MLRLPLRRLGALAVAGGLLASCREAGEGERQHEQEGERRGPERPAPPSSAAKSAPRPREFAFEGSAYSATLAHDSEAFYVITERALFRVPFVGEVEAHAGSFGTWPALADDVVIWHADGALWQVTKRGGKPMRYAVSASVPERIVASGASVVWQLRRGAGGFALAVRGGEAARIIYEGAGQAVALAVDDARAYFVEALGGGFRIGAVPLSGGAPLLSRTEAGRPPASLAVVSGEPVFYDGARSVRRMSSDLTSDRVVARETICSPLAVSDATYCAQPRTVVEVREGAKPRVLAEAVPGPITSIDTTEGRVAWLVDLGQGRIGLEVYEAGASR